MDPVYCVCLCVWLLCLVVKGGVIYAELSSFCSTVVYQRNARGRSKPTPQPICVLDLFIVLCGRPCGSVVPILTAY